MDLEGMRKLNLICMGKQCYVYNNNTTNSNIFLFAASSAEWPVKDTAQK
jgi:hypothetical protein